MAEKTPDALVPAFRQYRHNFGDDGVFIAAYDYETTNNVFAALSAEIERLTAELDKARQRAADAVPNSWLDPLLTGPNKVIHDEVHCCDIEALLTAIRKRILNGGEDG